MEYIVVYVDEDGEAYIETFSKERLEQYLDDNNWGDTPIHDNKKEPINHWNLFHHTPKLFIIKGSFVVPKAVATVTKYEVE